MTSPQRNKSAYSTRIYDFVRDILVECPQCQGKALVKSGNFQDFDYDITGVRVLCTACGYNKQMDKISRRSRKLILGAPVDPFFHLPLWLQTEFSGQLLWAYNLEHADFLLAHVGARLRERNAQKPQSRSIGARLPRWMTSKENRESVLKALKKLREKA